MDSTALRRLAASTQAKLDELYAVPGAPQPGSALDQAGLRNGFDIVCEYLDHNEVGVAFEHLLYMVREPDLVLSKVELEEVDAIGRKLGFSTDLWSDVRTR